MKSIFFLVTIYDTEVTDEELQLLLERKEYLEESFREQILSDVRRSTAFDEAFSEDDLDAYEE